MQKPFVSCNYYKQESIYFVDTVKEFFVYHHSRSLAKAQTKAREREREWKAGENRELVSCC